MPEDVRADSHAQVLPKAMSPCRRRCRRQESVTDTRDGDMARVYAQQGVCAGSRPLRCLPYPAEKISIFRRQAEVTELGAMAV